MARHNGRPEFAVIGLGRFGSSLALTLSGRGYSVLGIDRDRTIVQRISEQCTQAVALDATDEAALREVDIGVYDTVVVAIGANFEANLLTTVSLKTIGVRRVISKALTEQQRTILLRIGADRVVLPEHEAGRRLAQELVAPGILDHLKLGDSHSVVELQVPPSLARRTIFDAALRKHFGVTILAVKRGDNVIISPPADYVLAEEDLLVIIGANDKIANLHDLT